MQAQVHRNVHARQQAPAIDISLQSHRQTRRDNTLGSPFLLKSNPWSRNPRERVVPAASSLTLYDRKDEPRSPYHPQRHWAPEESAVLASSFSPESRSLAALIPSPIRDIKVLEEEQLLPLPRDVENLADDPKLHNPLQRSERMSTGWFGVVLEYDGVLVEDTSDLQQKAWLKVAEEERKAQPPQFALRRAEGMKNDQIIKEVFCWTREPMEVRRLAGRKEEVLTEMLGDMQPLLAPDVPEFMINLARNKVPAALATSAPEARVKPALKALGLENAFDGVVVAEDTYRGRPDPEPFLLAAQMLKRPVARCVVIGNSNQTVEAARECGMASVVVAGRKPLYELKAADLVVKSLSELRAVNLKQLFRNEDLVAAAETPEVEVQEEDDNYEDTSSW